MTTDIATAQEGAPTLLLGVNTFVWQSPLTTRNLVPTLENIAALGYEAVELALENLDDWDADLAADTLHRLGLASVVGGVFGPGRELTVASHDVIENTKAYVRGAIDLAVRQGSPMVIGPLYTSVGRTWRMDADERRRAVLDLRSSLDELGDYAGANGVRLAI
ncbi:MAG: sugar phosphate isomerase, partial [Frondihabitans sp.]|nr:sugar phosphate isomerase [Frondihabitans sp.]